MKPTRPGALNTNGGTTEEYAGTPERAFGDMAADSRDFDAAFRILFDAEFARVFRVLNRMAGDADMAKDLAQDAFVRLHARGQMPEAPTAWVISVGLNLCRNALSMSRRRRKLLTITRGERSHSDPSPAADAEVLAAEARARVRTALDALPERERALLLLRAEGYSYREIAAALQLNEVSIGTLLLRAGRMLKGGLNVDDAS